MLQPAAGHHRAGLEAVLIAAAVNANFSGVAVDLGAGAGVAGLCIAVRCPKAQVILAERDPHALECARASVMLPENNGIATRVSIVDVDVTASETIRARAGLTRASADVVVMNPPFHDAAAVRKSPGKARADAHVLADGGLEPWMRAAVSVLKPRGRLVTIFRADGLDRLLAALSKRFGDVAVLPIYPRAGADAHRVLVAARKGSRAPLSVVPPLVLHPKVGNSYLSGAMQILRDGVALSDVNTAWTLA